MYERNPESTRCTAVKGNGKFCDDPSLPNAPFPICLMICPATGFRPER